MPNIDMIARWRGEDYKVLNPVMADPYRRYVDLRIVEQLRDGKKIGLKLIGRDHLEMSLERCVTRCTWRLRRRYKVQRYGLLRRRRCDCSHIRETVRKRHRT